MTTFIQKMLWTVKTLLLRQQLGNCEEKFSCSLVEIKKFKMAIKPENGLLKWSNLEWSKNGSLLININRLNQKIQIWPFLRHL